MKKRQISFISAIFILLQSPLATAAGFDALTFRPATDTASYVSVWSPKTLKSGQFEAGTSFQYTYRLMQLYQNGNRANAIIDHAGIQHITGTVGVVNRWIQVSADMPVIWDHTFKNPNVAGASSSMETSLGDLNLHLKSQVFETKGFRLGLLSTLGLPTGNQQKFLGNEKASFTERALVEFMPSNRLSIALNAGFQIRDDEVFRDINKSDQLLLGLGAQYSLCKRFQVLAEVNTQTRLKKMFKEKVESPTEAVLGTRYLFKNSGLIWQNGVGVGIVYGSGAPLTRVFSGLSYAPAFKKKQKPLNDVQNTTIYFDSGKSLIKSDDKKQLNTVATLLANTDAKVQVTGHTDIKGSGKKNQDLSLNRANAVLGYLTEKGVNSANMKAIGKSDSTPVATNDTAAGRAKNRRVNLVPEEQYWLSNR